MRGVELEPGHAMVHVDDGLRKSSRTFLPVIQGCDHV